MELHYLHSYCWMAVLLFPLAILVSIDGKYQQESFVNPFTRIPLNLNNKRPPPFDFKRKSHINSNKENKAQLIDTIKQIVAALLYSRLTLEAEFPTAATSFNISQQCQSDSQLYYDSYTSLQNWALRSK